MQREHHKHVRSPLANPLRTSEPAAGCVTARPSLRRGLLLLGYGTRVDTPGSRRLQSGDNSHNDRTSIYGRYKSTLAPRANLPFLVSRRPHLD